MEDRWPGLWQRCLKSQCAVVGWKADWGCPLRGATANRGWAAARNALLKMRVGDWALVTLSGGRAGRLGEVIRLDVEDSQWDPLVPRTKDEPEGEMGRRIQLRWDLLNGPTGWDMVVELPQPLTIGELRPTISEVRSASLEKLRGQMADSANWVGLWSRFRWEAALSDWIATYPHRLQDGLLPHPDQKVRERVFPGGRRADVVLIDPGGATVVVECKQNAPGLTDVKQLCGYLRRAKRAGYSHPRPRGILVHGGPRKLAAAVAAEARRTRIEVVQYRLDVDFTPCPR